MLLRDLRFALLGFSLIGVAVPLRAQDAPPRHGRKYKAPPDTSHIEVVVTKKATGKPVVNAAVVFRAVKNGKDDGNLEVKTDPDGKAAIDVIETGSTVTVQVIANGFATFADKYQVDGPSREIAVSLLRPQEQVSAYVDNSGKEASRKAGVQDAPDKPKPVPPTAAAKPATPAQPQGQSGNNGTAPKQ